jgi:hypothetical protein
MKCEELPQLKQRLLLLPSLNCGKFDLDPVAAAAEAEALVAYLI